MHNVSLPKNLPLLVSEKNPDARAALDRIMRGETTGLESILLALGHFWKIRVWFDQPVTIHLKPHWVKNKAEGSQTIVSAKITDNYTFSYLLMTTKGLCYRTARNYGYVFEWLDRIVKYEPVVERDKETVDQFKSFDEFKRRFDPQFISEEKIQELWDNPSSQTGQRYRRSDFHHIGREGQQVMGRFLHFFKGVGTGVDAPGYFKSNYKNADGSEYFVLSEHYTSNGRGRFGRDITISHQTNQQIVHYSSEYPGCGNGRYGLVANKTTFLHLEDD
jgi:hypothetical protein